MNCIELTIVIGICHLWEGLKRSSINATYPYEDQERI